MRKSGLRPLAAVLGFLLAMVLVPPHGATNPGFQSAVTIRSPISPTGDPFRAVPNSNTSGTSCAGASPAGSIAPCSSRIRSTTHRNTTAIAPWATSNDAAAHKDTVDPEAWAIVDGKLYLAHNSYWIQKWRENAEEHIQHANASWPAVAALPDPVIVGPPCSASPPSTLVTLRDGGHWVVVAGQVARDGMGNVVGKGDMRAQIEQVGKNVGACLKAGGASVEDIIGLVSYVTDVAEFSQYPDLRQRYFGSPSQWNATAPVPQLPGDFLVQVEAFALIR